ncbi:MAG: CDP-alcohol phosphatidyltransferase family protein [Robiginitomaculum sp.]|nr:CDP-alcohol phosphatidyltransferase family protein [Robiginitomaculum sp.]
MTEPEDIKADSRRPIAARNTGWADKIASGLARTGITPNQISVASMVFGVLAAGLFYLTAEQFGARSIWVRAALLISAIIAIQFRLLCNLFDGMVAVEGGKGAKDGPFWNEFPDRVADLAIFAGAGYAAGYPELGWAVGGLAVMAAYVRELGRAVGLDADFVGPMAKQHRMALLCLGALIACFEHLWNWSSGTLFITLIIIAVGTIMTIIRRAVRQVRALKKT